MASPEDLGSSVPVLSLRAWLRGPDSALVILLLSVSITLDDPRGTVCGARGRRQNRAGVGFAALAGQEFFRDVHGALGAGSSVVARVRHGGVAAVSGARTSVSVNGTLRLHSTPVSRPAVSVVSCECGRASLRCEVERGTTCPSGGLSRGVANASLGRAPCSPWSRRSAELVCVASNGVSAETSDPLKPDCPDAVTPYRVSETEATEGYKNYARLKLCIELFLGACGVLLAILFAILCIASRDREGPNTERGPSPEETGVVYSQVRITNRDK
ncbi:hypothetical protein ANANG_G00072560 [Anguilla anguilla]|uniref:Uncharacterized protein n=1 Tax=Anguilla anguilla TaxID=7936 RepID=A0A9D3MSR2_ANGAN|nr:hypothetical protein ANANG_G00072560 [Anguilla anguilla]